METIASLKIKKAEKDPVSTRKSDLGGDNDQKLTKNFRRAIEVFV